MGADAVKETMALLIDAGPAPFSEIYLAAGYTDLRKNIDGLVDILYQTYHVNPEAESPEHPCHL